MKKNQLLVTAALIVFSICIALQSPANAEGNFERSTIHDTIVPNCSDTETCDPNIRVPLCFTPNGDGDHDQFIPVYAEDTPESMELIVYNRLGALMYNMKDTTVKWDGMYKNNKCASGIYHWVITTYYSGKKKVKCNGMVMLIDDVVIRVEIPK